ncbi:MAG: DUF1440 domain-containing protein, partial [Acidobacteria bacterium]|nr:DUF1440 domain-containing protein [Acidobacteriota bacterium]
PEGQRQQPGQGEAEEPGGAEAQGGADDPGAAEHQGEADEQDDRDEEDEEDENATVRAASAISQRVFGLELTEGEKKVAGPAVHYAFGSLTGCIYGMAAELLPQVAAGRGLPFGAAVWLAADEAAVPALGLAEPPHKVPASTHAMALASHFVYGLTTDAVRRWVRELL